MKILIWGLGQLLFQTVKKIPEKNIAGYIDTYKTKDEFAGKPLYAPDELQDVEYDAILVSTFWSEEVAQTCRELAIPLERVIFVYGNIRMSDMNPDYAFVTKTCGEKFADFIKNRYHLIREKEIDHDMDKKDFDIGDYSHKKYYRNDYVRLKTLELLVDEIKRYQVQGQIAELGVFQGDFASLLNAAFPDRKLYLFDTFQGFSDEELEKELEGDMTLVTRDIYKDATSVQIVMDKMKYPENVIVKKGFFPDSLEGLDEKFAVVSLDCDWEESLYQGLLYFYPRLSEGGYILLHDYNNLVYCAKRAMKRYEQEMNIRIAKVPLCDAQGSLIITK